MTIQNQVESVSICASTGTDISDDILGCFIFTIFILDNMYEIVKTHR
jgi:hypothetical protein